MTITFILSLMSSSQLLKERMEFATPTQKNYQVISKDPIKFQIFYILYAGLNYMEWNSDELHDFVELYPVHILIAIWNLLRNLGCLVPNFENCYCELFLLSEVLLFLVFFKIRKEREPNTFSLFLGIRNNLQKNKPNRVGILSNSDNIYLIVV